jgi:polysaccharide pyruvyl transferase WcaK-like protein
MEAYPIFREHPVGISPSPGDAPPIPIAHPQPEDGRLKAVLKAIPMVFEVLKGVQSAIRPIARSPREALFMARNYRLLRSLDALVMPGSGQLGEEWGGPWSYPYALFQWCSLARLAGCRIAFLGTGSGSLTSMVGRAFVRVGLSQANHLSYRDPRTRDLAASLGVNGGDIVPDLVFGLRWDRSRQTLARDAPRGRGVVGINPIPYCSPAWFQADADVHAEYLDKVTAMGEWLVEQGYRVLFFPTEIRADRQTIDDIMARLLARGVDREQLLCPETLTLRDVLAHVASCDYVIASRFHGALLSYLQSKPVLSLAFHFKLTLLAKEMGQERYCLDISSFRVDELRARFEELVADRDGAVAKMGAAMAGFPEILEKEYRVVAELVGVPST